MRTDRCAKCGQSMEEGFLMSRGEHTRQLQWAEGRPERFLFLFLRFWGKRRAGVLASRCTSCGFLELYAPPDNG